jgi:hypothetical protein
MAASLPVHAGFYKLLKDKKPYPAVKKKKKKKKKERKKEREKEKKKKTKK